MPRIMRDSPLFSPLLSPWLIRACYLTAVAALSIGAIAAANASGLWQCTDKNGKTSWISSPPTDTTCKLLAKYGEKDKEPAAATAPVKKTPKRVTLPAVDLSDKGVDNTIKQLRRQYPRVSTATQKKRDQTRQAVLDYELRSEINRLLRTREYEKTLDVDTENYDKQLAIVKKKIRIHLLNIRAIQQELARLD